MIKNGPAMAFTKTFTVIYLIWMLSFAIAPNPIGIKIFYFVTFTVLVGGSIIVAVIFEKKEYFYASRDHK